jgi:hypothetical protein
MFHEVQFGIAGTIEVIVFPESIVPLQLLHCGATAQHRLKNEQIACRMFINQIQCEQGMTQMVEHAEKQHDVEPFSKRPDVVHGDVAKFDVEAADFRSKARLAQIILIRIDAEHACCSVPLHFE